ncbi:MAG TPA: HEAT repeat domain-containing protein [Bryobacteraceae bacterium]|nr:HEAT repeat domain-containing protein [Bryobacteraceae bacterium]
MFIQSLSALVLIAFALLAQDGSKQVIKMLKDVGKDGGPQAIERVKPYLNDGNVEVRREAVTALVRMGGLGGLDLLVAATKDPDEEIQIRAADGLVNFYLPGYIEFGLTASLKRAGTSLKSKFSDTNDQVIPAYVEVREDVVLALGALARGGISEQSRANAARAVGVLRGRAAIPDLAEAVKSKKGQVIYECLVAFQKIGDPAAADSFSFLLRDLDEKVQIAAIEATGQLRNKSAIPRLREVLGDSKSVKVKRAALISLAKLPDEASRPVFEQFILDRDDGLRAAAGEGFARLKNPEDAVRMVKLFDEEKKMSPRLSLAFAAVMLGKRDLGELSPLQYLVNTLNSYSWRGISQAFLIELCREQDIREALYPVMHERTKEEKIYLADVLARTYSDDARPALEKLSQDGETEVAQAGARAIRTLGMKQ